MQSFFGTKRVEIEALCEELGVPVFHSHGVFRNVYKYQQPEPWQDNDLPKKLIKFLDAEFALDLPKIELEEASKYDNSVKLLLRLSDGSHIEMVLMPEARRITLCISSQVGCRQGCVFCHTGRMGLKRNLKASEIVGQIVVANQWILTHPDWFKGENFPGFVRVTNIVFMGMGEPFDNIEEVLRSIHIMTDPYGFAIGPRKVSVSTAGNTIGIERLLSEFSNVRIAVSVQAAEDSVRSKLMPINKEFPISEVLAKLRDLLGKRKEYVLIQYSLIQGVNDSIKDAERLIGLIGDLKVKVNLIPLNSIEVNKFVSPPPKVVESFRDTLHNAGIRTMIRYSKGQDIGAACGQLVSEVD